MISRADRSAFAEWWWTVDRFLFFAFLFLIGGGLLLSLAASPAVAERIKLDSYHFVQKHVIFTIPAFLLLFGISFLNPRQIRRFALAVFVISFLLMLATFVIGSEVKGAKRWLSFFGFSLQPSEFIKPAFIILSGWLFAESVKRRDVPGNIVSILLLVLVVVPLVLQPDFGQTVLIALVWGAMFFMAGLSWIWIAVLAGIACIGFLLAYLFLPHVTGRINRFIDPTSGDTFQVDKAINSIIEGGWFGRGPGEGVVKRVLPDSHTDFIFAVAAEEYGIIICLMLVAVFAFVVMRGLYHAMQEADPFIRLALGGLVALFGFQAVINMSVNLQLMPAKGMTLPFISYGGSSLLSVAIGAGLILALTRKRPKLTSALMGGHGPDNSQTTYAEGNR